MAESKVATSVIASFFNENGFIAHYRSFLHKLAPEGGHSPTHGRRAVIAFKGGSGVTLTELRERADKDPKATMKLPKFKIVQYKDGPINDKLEMMVEITSVSKDDDLWKIVLGVEVETEKDKEDLLACVEDDYPIAKFLGRDANDHPEYLGLYAKMRSWIDHITTNSSLFTPLEGVEDTYTKKTSMSLTQYASKWGVRPDMMHMVEKFIDDWVAKASKCWDSVELKGDQITTAYYNTWGRSSCMANAAAVLCGLYANNPHAVSMFLVAPEINENTERSSVARVLVWTTANGDVVVDRPYHGIGTCNPGQDTKTADAHVFKAIASRYPNKKIFTLYTGPNQKPMDKDDVVIVRIPESGLMPYLDTMLHVWSPADDVTFVRNNKLKASTIFSVTEKQSNCSRIAYLSSSSGAILNFITKILGKTPVGTPNVRTARQQDGSPYATLTQDHTKSFKCISATTLKQLMTVPAPKDVNPPPCILTAALRAEIGDIKDTSEVESGGAQSSLMRQTLSQDMYAFLADAPGGVA